MLKHHAAALTLALAAFAGSASAGVDEGWVFKITAAAGDYRSVITLGAYPDASDDYDAKYDAPVFTSSLTMPSNVSARFPHPEWNRSEKDYLYDIRAIAPWRQWTFEAESEFADKDMTVEWDTAALPANYALTLTDTTTGRSVNMNAQSSYRFPNTGARTFTVIAQASASQPASDNATKQPAASGGGSGGGLLDPASLLILLLAWPLTARRRG